MTLEDATADGSPDWKAAIGSAFAHMKVDGVNVAAGAFAYRWFLSLFPIIIALLGIAALVTVPRQVVTELIDGVTKALPSAAAGVFAAAISHAALRHGGNLAATTVAAVVGLWSATSGMVVVQEGLDMAYELPQGRSFLAKRLLAFPLLAAGTVLGGAASALIVFGPQLGASFEGVLPFGHNAFFVAWTAIRWVVALALMSLLFSVLYYLAPNQKRARWRWTSPGALVGTILWALVSLGFSYYTSSFGSYNATYGALAGVAILIFWLYLTGLAILVGAELNAAFERIAVQTKGAESGSSAGSSPS